MAWQPAPESLRTLIGCVKDSHNGFDKAAQKQAEMMLSQAKASPDFNHYLAYIFSSPAPPAGVALSGADYAMVRVAAGIMLKNAIKTGYKQTSADALAVVKAAVLAGLRDDSQPVRNYAGNIATELVRRGGLYAWPELLPALLLLVANGNANGNAHAGGPGPVAPATQEAAMAALAKICEDNAKLLDREQPGTGQRPLNVLLPQLLEASASPLPRVRALALTAVNEFIPYRSQAVLASIDALLQRLFALAPDPHNDVRREVCRAFVYLVETRPDKLQPHLAGIVDYIIAQQQCPDDEDLACQAVEFWLSAAEHHDFWHSLQPYVAKILPSLLDSMVYSGEDIALYGNASDDDDEDDREQDIRPQFAKPRSLKRGANGASGGDDAAAGYAKLPRMDEDGLEEGEIGDNDDDDDDDDDDNASAPGAGADDDDDGFFDEDRWSVRKGSAAALDVLAHDFGDAMFDVILPYLNVNLKHPDWPRREAAVLALGAIADGCMDAVTPHLPQLVPYLLSLLADPEPLVRQITCWTLARYAKWALGLVDPAPRAQFFEPMLQGFLARMLDKNKKVQEAAASAMATLEEKAGSQLEPYTAPILRQYVPCFDKYKDRNMYILYDCVQTLAEGIGPALARPDLVDILMPALLKRYALVTDQARELSPLLECLSYVAASLGSAFAPYAPPVFRRCVHIVHQNLEQSLAAAANAHLDLPDKDYLVTSLDLLSAIVQALAADDQAAALVRAAQPAFFELLALCLEDPTNMVRQSAYAVLGDCARFVFAELQPCLPTLLPLLLRQLDLDAVPDEDMDDAFGVVNNACWSAGEIALRCGAAIAPAVVDELLRRCVDVLTNPHVPRGVVENAAIALGRLGLAHHDAIAPHLQTFAAEFLDAMDDIQPSEEKATALRGFTLVVAQNPQAMEKVLVHYFQTMARYRDISLHSPTKQELHGAFHDIILVYRRIIPQFDDFLAHLDKDDVRSLTEQYVY